MVEQQKHRSLNNSSGILFFFIYCVKIILYYTLYNTLFYQKYFKNEIVNIYNAHFEDAFEKKVSYLRTYLIIDHVMKTYGQWRYSFTILDLGSRVR
jgi:hypothetical protein